MTTNKHSYVKTEDGRPSDAGLVDEDIQAQVFLLSVAFEPPLIRVSLSFFVSLFGVQC